MKAWQCIGCGKIEAPQTCIGICQGRKVQFVYASEREEVLATRAVRTSVNSMLVVALFGGCLGGFEVLGLIGLLIGPVVLTLARDLWEQRVRDLARARRHQLNVPGEPERMTTYGRVARRKLDRAERFPSLF